MSDAADEALRNAVKLLRRIEPIMHGQGSDVQGIVLLHLASTWAMGHHPVELRERLVAYHTDALRDLVRTLTDIEQKKRRS